MNETRFNFLTEPLLTVAHRDGLQQLDLPSVLASLSRGEETELLALQAHQQIAWHAFTVQLAAIALHHQGRREPPPDAEAWRELLLSLTDGRHEPWCLYVEDLSQPALFQPPVPEGGLARYGTSYPSPDELDYLVPIRNFDMKSGRHSSPSPEHWCLALLNLQTMQGYSGRANYGVLRMKSGFGNRPQLSLQKTPATADAFLRDLGIALDHRERLVQTYGYAQREPVHRLLWLMPWDGDSSLAIPELDPYFLEICRRVRIGLHGNELIALQAPTNAQRVGQGSVEATSGNTGDLWTPLDRANGSALTISSTGFSYTKLTEILFGTGYSLCPSIEVRPADGTTPWLVARALPRGQGKTEGYHERWLPFPEKARQRLGDPDQRAELGALAKARIERVDVVNSKVLAPAIRKLAHPDKERKSGTAKITMPWTGRLSAAVDAVFFEELWRSLEQTSEEAKASWDQLLGGIARQLFDEALETVTVPAARAFAARAKAEGLFYGLLGKHFLNPS